MKTKANAVILGLILCAGAVDWWTTEKWDVAAWLFRENKELFMRRIVLSDDQHVSLSPDYRGRNRLEVVLCHPGQGPWYLHSAPNETIVVDLGGVPFTLDNPDDVIKVVCVAENRAVQLTWGNFGGPSGRWKKSDNAPLDWPEE